MSSLNSFDDGVDQENLDITDELIAERRSAVPGELPDDMPLWMSKIIGAVDRLNLWVGKIICIALIPMCVAMVYEVIARKFFLAPTLWAYDISRMLYGAMFVIGAGYALSVGVHIRADFIYRNWRPRKQAIVDALLFVMMYFPGMIFFFFASYSYAVDAWMIGERGMDTAWMPHMGPIKSALPIGVALLILQGVSELFKCLYAAKHNRWPV